MSWQESMKALFRRQSKAIIEGRPTLVSGSARSWCCGHPHLAAAHALPKRGHPCCR